MFRPDGSLVGDGELEQLMRLGDEAWQRFVDQCAGAFQYLIPADYRLSIAPLQECRPRSRSFVELGSGVGVITILADLLGYDAYGIEIEGKLVNEAATIADRFGSNATFVEGSFVPPAYRDDIEHLSADFLTITEGADAYDELGMQLEDFDLVYSYPWPGEEDWLDELLRRHAPQATLMQYSVSDGFTLTEPT